jgi:putative ABC transport system substrate-binding protein
MRRRDFLALVGGAAGSWPFAAGAQGPSKHVIGYLYSGTTGAGANNLEAFRKGLSEAGYVEGRDVEIELRFAQNEMQRLPEFAAELVRRQVAVIVATGSPATVSAAKAATATIPIVFAMADDPVRYGLVTSLNRPGGNVTGIYFLTGELGGKRLSLLLELVPQSSVLGYLAGPRGSLVFENQTNDMLAAGRALGREIIILGTRPDFDFERNFAILVRRKADALAVAGYAAFLEPRHRDAILGLAARHKIPTIYPSRVYTVSGGLMSYSADVAGAYRRLAGDYVARILKGTRPAELPVQQSTNYQLTINLRTARSLGIPVPPKLIAWADEVIE